MQYKKRTAALCAVAVVGMISVLNSSVYAEGAQKSSVQTKIEAPKNTSIGVYVGEQAAFSLKSPDEYDRLLKKLQNHFKSEGSRVVSVQIEPALTIKENESGDTLSVDEAFDYLLNGAKQEAVYIAEATESMASIAKRFRMSEAEIKALNPNWEDPITQGTQIKVLQPAPLIQVEIEEIIKNYQDIPYDVREKKDDTKIKTIRIVERKGVPGRQETYTNIKRQNGKVVSSIVEKSHLVKEPVDEIVVVGTKDGYATGNFIKPTEGRFTSPFGPRWGRFHYGIDLANAVGTDIKAADGGIVTRAGFAGSYGNLIIIDHQNGHSTRYAHLSRIDVKVGDVVQQGASIGKMGNTGRSTGSHLHFEIRVDGVAQNPLDFIKL